MLLREYLSAVLAAFFLSAELFMGSHSQPCSSACSTCSAVSNNQACTSCSQYTSISSTACVAKDDYQITYIDSATIDALPIAISQINYLGNTYTSSFSANVFGGGGSTINFDFSVPDSQVITFEFSGLGTSHLGVALQVSVNDDDSRGTLQISLDGSLSAYNVISTDEVYVTSEISHSSDLLQATIKMPINGAGSAYIQDLTIILHKCNTGCSRCSETSSNCSDCQNVKPTVYYKSYEINKCLNRCPDKYWGDDSSNRCRACHHTCETCTSATDCTSCGSFYFLHTDKTCYKTCPDRFYGQIVSGSTNLCRPCDIKCEKCYGPSADECVQCRIEGSTPYFLEYGTNKCSADCPASQYKDTLNLKCLKCDETCQACENSADNCLPQEGVWPKVIFMSVLFGTIIVITIFFIFSKLKTRLGLSRSNTNKVYNASQVYFHQ